MQCCKTPAVLDETYLALFGECIKCKLYKDHKLLWQLDQVIYSGTSILKFVLVLAISSLIIREVSSSQGLKIHRNVVVWDRKTCSLY